MKRIGISPEEWDALAAGRTVTLRRVPFDRKGEFQAGGKLTVGRMYRSELAEASVQRVIAFDDCRGYTLEVSGFRMLAARAYGEDSKKGGEE